MNLRGSASTPRSEFLAGMRDTIPMDVGALPFGIIFGALFIVLTTLVVNLRHALYSATLAGIVAGRAIPNPERWGLDFAATVTFTGMIVSMLHSRSTGLAVIAAGAVALLANPLPNRLGLMLAALAGVVAGVIGKSLFRENRTEGVRP